MPKQLYEEALADAKKVIEVAEDNAKRAVLEAVIPRIRKLIENELMSEDLDGDNDSDDLMFDDEAVVAMEPRAATPAAPGASVVMAPVAASPADAITPPDADGKVTLDLNTLGACEPSAPVAPPMFGAGVPAEEPAFELGMESLSALQPLVGASKAQSLKALQQEVSKLEAHVKKMKSAAAQLGESAKYNKQITQMISRVENMYEYVQERVTSPAAKKVLEEKLESYFQELTRLQELKMPKTLKDLIKEDDAQLGGDMPAGDEAGGGAEGSSPGELTLKLTGLPADVDLDSVGVDLVADDESGDESGAEASGDESGGGDLGDLDLGGSEEAGDQMESTRLSDDTIVEIDENMLRREIARMKKIREAASEKPGDANGHGVTPAVMDDFGGAKDEGEPFLDGEVTTESEEMDEGDYMDEGDDLDEADDLDESDDDDSLDELQNRRKADSRGVSADSDMSVSKTESINRRIAFEKRLQERAKSRAAALKKEAASAKPAKKAQLQKEHTAVAQRFNASVARVQKLSKLLKEASDKNRSNSGSQQPAESKAVQGLRKQLAEQSLLNMKLVYANKLLQNESLTRKQKAHAIEKLDEATNVREAKLVYESLVKALGGKPLKESVEPKVLGSSSRPTRTGSAQTLNEGFETDRWAQLAGITAKR